MSAVCPECQQGKHQNCDGTAWDDAADAPGACACTDSTHQKGHDPHVRTRETSGAFIRIRCTCGWAGRWRRTEWRNVETLLHGDDGTHLYAVGAHKTAAPK